MPQILKAQVPNLREPASGSKRDVEAVRHAERTTGTREVRDVALEQLRSVVGATTYSTQGVIQAEGTVTRVPLTSLRDAFRGDGFTMDLLLRYTGVHLMQVTQNALCNALHSVEQRLSKWLLVMRDRVGANEVHLTQEFLAQMLGIPRPGVTNAIGALTKAGLIEHSRNRIEFASTAALAARACMCYAEISTALGRFPSGRRGEKFTNFGVGIPPPPSHLYEGLPLSPPLHQQSFTHGS